DVLVTILILETQQGAAIVPAFSDTHELHAHVRVNRVEEVAGDARRAQPLDELRQVVRALIFAFGDGVRPAHSHGMNVQQTGEGLVLPHFDDRHQGASELFQVIEADAISRSSCGGGEHDRKEGDQQRVAHDLGARTHNRKDLCIEPAHVASLPLRLDRGNIPRPGQAPDQPYWRKLSAFNVACRASLTFPLALNDSAIKIHAVELALGALVNETALRPMFSAWTWFPSACRTLPSSIQSSGFPGSIRSARSMDDAASG